MIQTLLSGNCILFALNTEPMMLAGYCGTILFLLVQLLLNFLTKKHWVKMIPVYLLMLLSGITAYSFTLAGLVEWDWVGIIPVGIVSAVLTGLAGTGDILAWIIYGIYRLVTGKKHSQSADDVK